MKFCLLCQSRAKMFAGDIKDRIKTKLSVAIVWPHSRNQADHNLLKPLPNQYLAQMESQSDNVFLWENRYSEKESTSKILNENSPSHGRTIDLQIENSITPPGVF